MMSSAPTPPTVPPTIAPVWLWGVAVCEGNDDEVVFDPEDATCLRAWALSEELSLRRRYRHLLNRAASAGSLQLVLLVLSLN